jgi:hypothetical protein
MKETIIEFNVGDIVYSAKGQNRITGDLAILKQKVECVMLEIDNDGNVNEVSYILTDDIGKDRSTKAKAVFSTIEEAIEYVNNKDE